MSCVVMLEAMVKTPRDGDDFIIDGGVDNERTQAD